jgi:segregation and condensation protein B
VDLTPPAPVDPEQGAEVISLTGHRLAAPAEAEADDIVDQDDGVLEPPPEHMMRGAVEALLLAADGPVSIHVLDGWLGEPGVGVVRDTLRAIAADMMRQQGGWRLVEVAKGWQLRTDVRFGRWVARMRGGRPQRLSTAAMDVLAIVAYRQPCTRSEVDQLRGVDSGGVLRLLCERGLTAVMGRKEVPGRPLLYGTTKNFLSLFGLRDLSDLPTLRDLRELRRDDERLPPGAAELLGISPEQLGRALGLEDDSVDELADDFEGVQTHLFEVSDDESDLDDEQPAD